MAIPVHRWLLRVPRAIEVRRLLAARQGPWSSLQNCSVGLCRLLPQIPIFRSHHGPPNPSALDLPGDRRPMSRRVRQSSRQQEHAHLGQKGQGKKPKWQSSFLFWSRLLPVGPVGRITSAQSLTNIKAWMALATLSLGGIIGGPLRADSLNEQLSAATKMYYQGQVDAAVQALRPIADSAVSSTPSIQAKVQLEYLL